MGQSLSDPAFLQPHRREHGGQHSPGHGQARQESDRREYHPNLHFEACYYQAIDFAIARKLARVEAGAQGPHKLARGYVPKSTHSLHYLAHPGLARAVADYLEHERRAVAENQSALAEHAPFRNAVEDDF